jgi:anti-anti-sigma factor
LETARCLLQLRFQAVIAGGPIIRLIGAAADNGITFALAYHNAPDILAKRHLPKNLGNSYIMNTASKILKLGSTITGQQADALREQMLQIITPAVSTLVLDFAAVQHLDSVGLGVIISAHNSLKRNNAKLALVNVSEKHYYLFRAMGLHRHFDIQPLNCPSAMAATG